MGNCTGGCSCKETLRERQARQMYQSQQNTNSKNTRSTTNKLASISETTSSSLTRCTPTPTPKLTINAKTMELLAPMEDIGLTPIETDKSIPDIMQSVSFELNEIERNVTDARIKELKNCHNSEELEKKITEQYDTTDHDMDDDDDDDIDSDDDESMSSLSEEEMKEIERRKSELSILSKNSISKRSCLLRDNTVTPWDEDDIEQLECDLTQQLAALTNQMSVKCDGYKKDKNKKRRRQSDPHLNIPNYRIVTSDLSVSDNDADPPLFRDKSSDKWDDQCIDAAKDAMQRQMIHLMRSQMTSTSSTT